MASNGAEAEDAIRQLFFLWAGWRDSAKIDIFLTTPSWALTPEILSIYGMPLSNRYYKHGMQYAVEFYAQLGFCQRF